MFERWKNEVKLVVAAIPIAGPILSRGYRLIREMRLAPFDSAHYWENRYRQGGTSGAGSYDKFAQFKAAFLNAFVREHEIASVIELGCGDGNQLRLAEYSRYLGFDVSEKAVEMCRAIFREEPTKRFALMSEYRGERAPLTLSLDVVFHLVEDRVFEEHMGKMFDWSERFAVFYSSNEDKRPAGPAVHVRHRKFTDWVARERPAWRLARHVPNAFPYAGDDLEGSFSDFYVFERT